MLKHSRGRALRRRARTGAATPAGTIFTRCAIILAMIAAFTCGCAGMATAQESGDADKPGRADGSGTGLYLGAYGGSNFLKLEFDERAALPSRGLTWDPWGPCMELMVGYGFGPGFRAEVTLGGSGHRAHPAGSQAANGGLRFTGYVPVVKHGAIRPHLIGGLCVDGAFFQMTGENDLNYFLMGGEGGAGLRAALGRHLALQVDYLHTVLDIGFEMASNGDNGTDQTNVGRRGRMETVRAGLVYDF